MELVVMCCALALLLIGCLWIGLADRLLARARVSLRWWAFLSWFGGVLIGCALMLLLVGLVLKP